MYLASSGLPFPAGANLSNPCMMRETDKRSWTLQVPFISGQHIPYRTASYWRSNLPSSCSQKLLKLEIIQNTYRVCHDNNIDGYWYYAFLISPLVISYCFYFNLVCTMEVLIIVIDPAIVCWLSRSDLLDALCKFDREIRCNNYLFLFLCCLRNFTLIVAISSSHISRDHFISMNFQSK